MPVEVLSSSLSAFISASWKSHNELYLRQEVHVHIAWRAPTWPQISLTP